MKLVPEIGDTVQLRKKNGRGQNLPIPPLNGKIVEVHYNPYNKITGYRVKVSKTRFYWRSLEELILKEDVG